MVWGEPVIPQRDRNRFGFAVAIIIKAVFIAGLYVATSLWKVRPTWRSQEFNRIAVDEAKRAGWGPVSIASAHLIASMLMRIRDDNAYDAWFDRVVTIYASKIRPSDPKDAPKRL